MGRGVVLILALLVVGALYSAVMTSPAAETSSACLKQVEEVARCSCRAVPAATA